MIILQAVKWLIRNQIMNINENCIDLDILDVDGEGLPHSNEYITQVTEYVVGLTKYHIQKENPSDIYT